jgi:hypothetical protein
VQGHAVDVDRSHSCTHQDTDERITVALITISESEVRARA